MSRCLTFIVLLLLQENAIPLAIYVLGHNYTQQQRPGPQAEEDPLDAAKPALCALLQRLAARDRGVGWECKFDV